MNAAVKKPGNGAMIVLIVLSTVAMIFIAAGIIGLTQPDLVPQLARPAVAWSLVSVGVLIDVYAGVQFVLVARRRAAGSTSARGRD